jgi:hypothetical protein
MRWWQALLILGLALLSWAIIIGAFWIIEDMFSILE